MGSGNQARVSRHPIRSFSSPPETRLLFKKSNPFTLVQSVWSLWTNAERKDQSNTCMQHIPSCLTRKDKEEAPRVIPLPRHFFCILFTASPGWVKCLLICLARSLVSKKRWGSKSPWGRERLVQAVHFNHATYRHFNWNCNTKAYGWGWGWPLILARTECLRAASQQENGS